MSQDSGFNAQNTAGPVQEDPLVYAWVAGLLHAIEGNLSEDTSKRVLKECSLAHYRSLNMDALVAPYRGNLPGFIQFLEEKWRWKVDYDPAAQVITADEDKPDCVCPVVRLKAGRVSGVLCNCSEGFAERMFSGVVGAPVKAQVVRSILRGDPTCVYRVTLV